MGETLTKFGVGLMKTFMTRKMLINAIVLLAEWAVQQTDNDLDDQILEVVKKKLEERRGASANNLYQTVKAKVLK